MKKLLAVLLIAFSLNGFAQQKEKLWHTDVEKAINLSVKSGKPLYFFFTGSDWCGWCIKLQQAILKKSEFIKWANNNVVLVELDSPRRTPISDDLKKQNTELAQKFQVRGYPTGIFINSQYNSDGNLELNELGRHAVQLKPGTRQFVSPNTWIVEANKILKKK
jgi:protein disulfide-isomerase